MWILSPKAKDIDSMLNMKALIGSLLASLDRVFLGSFGYGLDLEGTEEQYELFKKMFPAIGRALEKTTGREGMVSLCEHLSSYRNSCMHPNVAVHRKMARIDPSFVNELPNYSDHPYILENTRLTLAGFLAIAMMMSNKEMLGNFFSAGIFTLANEIGLFPDYKKLNGRDYSRRVEEVFGTDFEVELRRVKGNDLHSALCGEYAGRVRPSEGGWNCYMNGKSIQGSDYFVFFRIDDYAGGRKLLRVKKGSFYHVYFPIELSVSIEDEDYFIELANMVPPFMILPYLFSSGIGVVNKQNFSEDRIFLYSKLNKAKFYVDKNVNTILMGNNFPDIRIISRSVAPQALYCLLKLESDLSAELKINEDKDNPMETRLADVLVKVGISNDLMRETISLRNFFAHGSVFGDYVGKAMIGYMKIGLEHCLTIFRKLVDELKTKHETIAANLRLNVATRVCEQISDIKYKAALSMCAPIINGFEIDFDQYSKTMKRILNSYVRTETEEMMGQLMTDVGGSRYQVCDCLVNPGIKISISGQTFNGDRILLFSSFPIDAHKIFGMETENRLISSTKNPVVSYNQYDFR